MSAASDDANLPSSSSSSSKDTKTSIGNGLDPDHKIAAALIDIEKIQELKENSEGLMQQILATEALLEEKRRLVQNQEEKRKSEFQTAAAQLESTNAKLFALAKEKAEPRILNLTLRTDANAKIGASIVSALATKEQDKAIDSAHAVSDAIMVNGFTCTLEELTEAISGVDTQLNEIFEIITQSLSEETFHPRSYSVSSNDGHKIDFDKPSSSHSASNSAANSPLKANAVVSASPILNIAENQKEVSEDSILMLDSLKEKTLDLADAIKTCVELKSKIETAYRDLKCDVFKKTPAKQHSRLFNQLTEILLSIQALLAEQTAYETAKTDLLQQMAEKDNQLNSASNELQNVKQNNLSELEEKERKLNKEHKDKIQALTLEMQTEIDNLKTLKSESELSIASMKTELMQLKSRSNHLQSEFDKNADILAAQQFKMDQQTKEITQLVEELKNTKTKLQQFETIGRDDKKNDEERNKRLLVQYERERSKNSALEYNNTQLMAELEKQRKELALAKIAHEKMLNQKQSEFESLEAQKLALEKEMTEFRISVEKAQKTEAKNLSQKSMDPSLATEVAQSETDDLRFELETAKKELEATRAQLKSMALEKEVVDRTNLDKAITLALDIEKEKVRNLQLKFFELTILAERAQAENKLLKKKFNESSISFVGQSSLLLSGAPYTNKDSYTAANSNTESPETAAAITTSSNKPKSKSKPLSTL